MLPTPALFACLLGRLSRRAERRYKLFHSHGSRCLLLRVAVVSIPLLSVLDHRSTMLAASGHMQSSESCGKEVGSLFTSGGICVCVRLRRRNPRGKKSIREKRDRRFHQVQAEGIPHCAYFFCGSRRLGSCPFRRCEGLGGDPAVGA